MGYEVDFLAVGEGEMSGDAIAVRFGDLDSRDRRDQVVLVIDGGRQDSGQSLVEHIRQHYETDYVDLVVNTHPDADHASGLSVVLEELEVGKLWMHRPWNHCRQIRDMFHDGRITDNSLDQGLRAALEDAHELEKIALRKGVPIEEPFAGLTWTTSRGTIQVLGPTQQYYEALLTDFRSTPEKKSAQAYALSHFGTWIMEGPVALAQKALESLGIETLEEPDDDATSAENNSSAILLLQVDGRQLLFTGDAGVPALERADDWAMELGIALSACAFTQIPHHGSKRNVGPDILNRILGPKLTVDAPTKFAFVSAAKEGAPKHPAKKVTNAYRRRGAAVYATQGRGVQHSHGAPPRAGWTSVSPVPFYSEVEED